jgi:hypothetical protein
MRYGVPGRSMRARPRYNGGFNPVRTNFETFSETMTDEQFRVAFRLSRDHVDFLVRELDPYLRPHHIQLYGRNPISTRERILLALFYFGRRGGQYAVSTTMTRHPQTIFNSADIVATAIIRRFKDEVIQLPDAEEMHQIINDFQELRGLPMHIGAMDGKHFKTFGGAKKWGVYKNYKKQRSLNVLAIADQEYLFRWVSDVKSGGWHDGQLWRCSKLYNSIQRGSWPPANHPTRQLNGVMLKPLFTADAAFEGHQMVIKPYKGSNLTERQRVFNKMQSRNRMVIEQAWGILVETFPIWKDDLDIRSDDWHSRMQNMMIATMILYNQRRKRKEVEKQMDIEVAREIQERRCRDVMLPIAIHEDNNPHAASHNDTREALADYVFRFYELDGNTLKKRDAPH